MAWGGLCKSICSMNHAVMGDHSRHSRHLPLSSASFSSRRVLCASSGIPSKSAIQYQVVFPPPTRHLRRASRATPCLMVSEAQVKQELSKLLKTADFSTATEGTIRQQLCDKFGDEVQQLKDLIKAEVNAYLDEAAGTTKRKADAPTENAQTSKLARTEAGPPDKDVVQATYNQSVPAIQAAESKDSPAAESDSIPAIQQAKKAFPRDGIDLGGKKRADVSTFKGQVYVSVREWYEKDGELKPGAKGISLLAQGQFSKIQENAKKITAALDEENEEYELALTDKRKVNISKFTGKATVNIREYYEKDGKQLPGKKGVMLTKDLWVKLQSAFSALLEEAGRLSSK